MKLLELVELYIELDGIIKEDVLFVIIDCNIDVNELFLWYVFFIFLDDIIFVDFFGCKMLFFIDEKFFKYDEFNIFKEVVELSIFGVNNIDFVVDWILVVVVLDLIFLVLKLLVVRFGEFNVSFIVEEKMIFDIFKDDFVLMIEDLDGIIFVEVWFVGGFIDDIIDELGKYNDESMVEILFCMDSVYCLEWFEK